MENIRQGRKVLINFLTVLTGIVGAWWYETGQVDWSWPSFIFTAVFIVVMVLLINYIEVFIRRKIKGKNK